MANEIAQQNASYRRGVVLGLTMAELALLIIFILLLVLGYLHQHEAREREELVRELAAEREKVERLLEKIPQLQELARTGRIGDLFIQLERVQQWQQEADKLRSRLDEAEQEAKRNAEAARALEEANLPTNPRSLMEIVKQLRESAGRGAERIQQLVEEITSLEDRLADADGRMKHLKKQLKSAGKGVDHPPCWPTPEGGPSYIFDVALTSDGLIIRDRNVPGREDDKLRLPLERIIFGTVRPPPEFLAETEPLYRWSVDSGCRFFVRAFDQTGPSEKQIYKARMRALEQRFYKRIMTEPFFSAQ